MCSSDLRKINNFFPLLPGYIESGKLSSMAAGARNSYRIDTDNLPREIQVSLTSSIASYYSIYDDVFGYNYLIPGDVQLDTLTDHEYLDAYPRVDKGGPQQVTSSMGLNDTVKFLFGFGDLNNIAYTKKTYALAAAGSISEEFAYGDGTIGVDQIPDYDTSDLKISWRGTPTTRGFYVAYTTGSAYIDTTNTLGDGEIGRAHV